jgi:hypothetical protein
MSRVTWKPGIVRLPSGKHARQIPQIATWNSALFIAQDGECARRYYDFIQRHLRWGEEEVPLVFDSETGCRIGMQVGTRWFSLEQCILLAWRHREPNELGRVVHNEGDPCHLKYLHWSLEIPAGEHGGRYYFGRNMEESAGEDGNHTERWCIFNLQQRETEITRWKSHERAVV